MWLSEQQKRPVPTWEGHTGTVTMGGGDLAVRVDSERRAPDLYGPAGYHWTPRAGDRVLVIKGEGERPCVVGVKQGGDPDRVDIRAGTVALEGELLVNGAPLEDYVRELVSQALEELK